MEGANLIRAMKYDDAVKKLSDAIHFNDQFIDAYMERAQVYELLSLQQEALNDYNKVKELRAATVADDDIVLPSRSKLSNNSDLITKLQYSIYQDSSSKGSTQRRTQSVLATAAHTHTTTTNIQHILSPDSSSTADSSSISEDQLRGSSKHDVVDDDGDRDDESMGHRKKKRKREKKKKKKKHKKVKKNKMRKQSD
jgi:tetratricopeptide (TPR) repeat protein